MINKDRIVPITAIDRLSLVGEMLTLTGKFFYVVKSDDVDGNFTIHEYYQDCLLDQPAKKISIPMGWGKDLYFVPTYDFEGIEVDGVMEEVETEIVPDGVTLYKARVYEGQVQVQQITPAVPQE